MWFGRTLNHDESSITFSFSWYWVKKTLSLRDLIQNCPVSYYLAALKVALQLATTSDSRFLTIVFLPSTGVIYAIGSGKDRGSNSCLRGLFHVCLLCKRNRNFHSWYPTGVPLDSSKGWHQDGATAQHTSRDGNSCPFQLCPNHRCYPSPAGKWFVRKEAQGQGQLVNTVKVKCPGRGQGAHEKIKHHRQKKTGDKRRDT